MLRRIIVGLVSVVAVCGAASAQHIIQEWQSTEPLPLPEADGASVAKSDWILVIGQDNQKSWVGHVDLASGEVLSWGETLAYPGPRYHVDAALVGDQFVVVPAYPESWIAEVGSSGSVLSWYPGPGTNTPTTEWGKNVIADGRRLYAVGGASPYIAYDTVETATLDEWGVLSPWEYLTPLPIVAHDPLVQIIASELYVFGGEGTPPSGDLTHSREIWAAPILGDGALGAWTQRGLLRIARPHSESIIADGTVHVLGGGVHSFITSEVESVPVTSFGITATHQLSAPLPTNLTLHSAVVLGGRAYVIGGEDQFFGVHPVATVYRADVGVDCSYGPAEGFTFVRSSGKPTFENAEWESCGGAGTLFITASHVTSAEIYVNGDLVVGPNAFPAAGLAIQVLLLEGTNDLSVRLGGKPGSEIQVLFVAGSP